MYALTGRFTVVVANMKRNLQLRFVTATHVHDQRLVGESVTRIVINGDFSRKRLAAMLADGSEEFIVCGYRCELGNR